MASRLFGAKPLSKLMLGYCQLYHKEQTSVKCNQNIKLFFHEYAYENVGHFVDEKMSLACMNMALCHYQLH